MFTINFGEEGADIFLLGDADFAELGATYMVYQLEMGEEGTPHLQGYLQFGQAVRRSAIAKVLDSAWMEPARGDPEQAKKYCTKEDRLEGPFEFGRMKGGQGSRVDILALRDAVKAGKSVKEIFEDDGLVGTAVRYVKGMEKMQEAFAPTVDRSNVHVTLHIGPAGTGKTHCCHSEDAYYYDGNGNGFWNGYRGQTKLILDEFSGSVMQPKELQRVLDVYPYQINVKGASCPLAAVDIHICSNYRIDNWWSPKTLYKREAVVRRIHVVHFHNKYKEKKEYVSDSLEACLGGTGKFAYDKFVEDNPLLVV